MKKTLHLFACAAMILTLAGCLGYRLEGADTAGIKNVTLSSIINKSGEPAIELQATRAIRDRIQFDGRLKLTNRPELADAAIEVTLTQFELTPMAYSDTKRTIPRLYRLRITAQAEMKRIGTGAVIARSETFGEATIPFQSDLTSAKRDAIPIAVEELAQYMVDDLIEQW